MGLFIFAFLLGVDVRAQFLNPRLQTGGLMVSVNPAVLDLTRDGSHDLHYPTFLGFGFTTSMDEEGDFLGTGVHGLMAAPAYPASSIPFGAAMGSADIDRDGRSDLVMVTNSGALVTAINAGSHRLDAGSFQPAVTQDFFGPTMVINPPFVNFAVPTLKTIDVNGDSWADIAFGVAPVDVWSGITHPGVFSVYRANGSGGFVKSSLPTPGNLIDLEYVDLDNNGSKDHFVYVTETGGVGAFAYELHHATYHPTQGLTYSGFSQYLPIRVTSLEVADVSGTGDADYVFPVSTPGPSGGPPVVYVYEGDGQGNMGAWSYLNLPPPVSFLHESILSIKSADFNLDGAADLAVLRSFCQTSSGGNQYDDAVVEVYYGPQLPSAMPVTLSTGGYVQDVWSTHYAANFLPQRSMPDLLTAIDLGRDGVVDLTLTHTIGRPAPSANPAPLLINFRNQTPPALGSPALVKVGAPSGPAPDNKGRAGFEGEPRVGNQNFRGTISNVAPGSLLGYVWGPVGIPYLFQQYGIDAHIAPAHYGYLKIADATGFGSYDLPIPNNPALIGDAGFFQWAFWNPATSHFGGTQATQVIIGQ